MVLNPRLVVCIAHNYFQSWLDITPFLDVGIIRLFLYHTCWFGNNSWRCFFLQVIFFYRNTLVVAFTYTPVLPNLEPILPRRILGCGYPMIPKNKFCLINLLIEHSQL